MKPDAGRICISDATCRTLLANGRWRPPPTNGAAGFLQGAYQGSAAVPRTTA